METMNRCRIQQPGRPRFFIHLQTIDKIQTVIPLNLGAMFESAPYAKFRL